MAASGGALARLRGGLVVSCQAGPDSPLRDSAIMLAMARAAERGGAVGLRLEGLGDVAAIRPHTALPIIGLVKQAMTGSEVYITPTVELARQLCRLGCEIVAVDGTARPRPASVAELCAAIHAEGRLAMADISTAAEAEAAIAAGADIVGTTMAGYTPYSTQGDAPDLALMRALAAAGLPFIAEGRVRTPGEGAACLAAGAWCVVVGSAITRPDEITRWFVDALATPAPVADPG
ncbi:MAG: N-acetylmannosamine-6-phosphate 2-epimerase [Geminicoccaceae bacterium]